MVFKADSCPTAAWPRRQFNPPDSSYTFLTSAVKSAIGNFQAKYLSAIRWLFHGQFTAQDAWMVDVMDAPPERLYRPDLSLTAWRGFVEDFAPTVQPAPTGRNVARS